MLTTGFAKVVNSIYRLNSAILMRCFVSVCVIYLLFAGWQQNARAEIMPPSPEVMAASKMTIIGVQVGYSTAEGIAVALDSHVHWSILNFNVSPTSFSGQAEFVMDSMFILSGSWDLSYDSVHDITTWQTDDWLYGGLPIIRAEGYYDGQSSVYHQSGDLLTDIGLHFTWHGTAKILGFSATATTIGSVGLLISIPTSIGEEWCPSDWNWQTQQMQYFNQIWGHSPDPNQSDIYGSFILNFDPSTPGSGIGNTTSPEPATITLLISGLIVGGLFLLRRRK